MLAMLESRFAGWLAKSPTPFSTHDQSQPAAAVVTMRQEWRINPESGCRTSEARSSIGTAHNIGRSDLNRGRGIAYGPVLELAHNAASPTSRGRKF
jgi:hypothetical protein